MHAWEAIQKTVNYIEEHIGEDIRIEDLADVAALSLFYYQRLFTRLVKEPVREYIKLRRLARAGEKLYDKKNRLIDIAIEYGFNNRETFTRAFKDAYGITPAQYRSQPVSLHSFEKPDLLLNYVMVDEGVPLINEGIVLEFNRRTIDKPIDFLGIRDIMPFKPGRMLGERTGVSVAGEIWDRFFKIRRDIPRISGGRNVGVCYHGGAPEGYTTYFAGTEVEPESVKAEVGVAEVDAAAVKHYTEEGRPTAKTPRFAHWQMPVREYVICEFEAENFDRLMDCLGKAMKYTRFWLKEHGLRADGFFPEMYYPNRSETSNVSGKGRSAEPSAYMELWIPFVVR